MLSSIILNNWAVRDWPIQVQPKAATPGEEFVPWARPQLYISVKAPALIIRRPFLASTYVAPPVNDPPFGRRVLWLNTVMDAWRPPPPMPTYPILGFMPPDSTDIIIWLWKRVS